MSLNLTESNKLEITGEAKEKIGDATVNFVVSGTHRVEVPKQRLFENQLAG